MDTKDVVDNEVRSFQSNRQKYAIESAKRMAEIEQLPKEERDSALLKLLVEQNHWIIIQNTAIYMRSNQAVGAKNAQR